MKSFVRCRVSGKRESPGEDAARNNLNEDVVEKRAGSGWLSDSCLPELDRIAAKGLDQGSLELVVDLWANTKKPDTGDVEMGKPPSILIPGTSTRVRSFRERRLVEIDSKSAKL